MAWALLQLALPAAATFADARLEHDSESSPGSHIESRTATSCPAVHRAECAFCQVVSRQSSLAPRPSTCMARVALVASPVIAEVPQRAVAGRARLTSRAPPLG